jgi:hypothetical protein
MCMTRLIAVVLAAASAGGFALGWLTFSKPSDAPTSAAAPAAVKSRPIVTHRFPLSAADAALDRETPAVAADARGRVLVAWASQSGDDERTLWLARSGDGGATFAKPAPYRTVKTYRYTSKMGGKEVVRSTSVVPRLASDGERMHLAWTEAEEGGPMVRFYVARTSDGGQTFSEPASASSDGAERPAFTAMSVGADGTVACAWLDHRNHVQQPFCSVWAPGGEPSWTERLAYPGPETGGVCPCCDTDVLRAADGGTFVAFRNNDHDYRDVCIARAKEGPAADFGPAVAVNRERWLFEGCPHDGPSLALSDDQLHVVWMDAHAGKRRIYYANSDIEELDFSGRELQPHAAGEQGHPKIVDATGALFVVWDASFADSPADETPRHEGHAHGQLVGAGRAVAFAWSEDRGASFSAGQAVAPREGAFQMNPSAAAGPAGVAYVVWNEIDEAGKSVGFARIAAKAK